MSPLERWLRLLLLIALLYGFLVAIDVLGSGIGGLGEDFVDRLFEGIDRPLVGLCVGILATVLAQSSSVTTPTIVTLVGAGVIDLQQAVPIVMGANIGTTITNTLASLGSIRRAEEFRRAFSGATMHDVFNVMSVAVLLPLELATGVLSRMAVALSGLVGDTATGEFQSPAKAAVAGVTEAFVSAVQALLGTGPLSGVALIVLGLALIFVMLFSITRNMKLVMAGAAERTLNRILGRSGTLGIVLGAALTVSVQSSSIATSLLIPMIAAGVLTLENAYPMTLGANIGTTVTAMLAAMAVDRIEGLQVALVHLLFNLTGVALLYPLPWLRRVPLRIARLIGEQAVRRRSTVFAYIVVVFYVVPLVGILALR
jgi:solute carrier family 34 (sodium-dependent phosphate cotransporter)